MDSTEKKSAPRPKGIDALLLCGDKGASRPVGGDSKAFLAIEGDPLFLHVLRALDRASRVGRVFVIGDKERLDAVLSEKGGALTKAVVTLEQWGDLASNAWNGFLATLDGYEPGMENTDEDMRDRVVFGMASDSPLVSSAEVDEFFDRADMDRYDYVVGLTPERAMSRYYPAPGRPGIKMAYLHLREGLFRINNMHMARPFAFANRGPIQKLYRSRYQKKLRNIARLARDIWGERRIMSHLWLYFLMQMSMWLTNMGLRGAGDMVRRRAPIDAVTGAMGDILGLRVGYAVTERGGAALDIDNDGDYNTMRTMFAEWKAAQA